LYDNTRLAVARIVKGGERLRSQMFAELQSHYLFEDRFGRPGKGNDKGKVEGLVGYVRRNFMTPLPVADSFDALNARFLDACVKRRQAILRGQTTTIGERMHADTSAFMPLPSAPYDACHKVATRVSSLSLVRYRNNDYSVPTRYGHQEVLAKGYVDRVEIACRGETIATHVRSYDRAEFIYNPLHYLALLEHKSRALDQAAPLDDWRLADCVYRLRDGSADGQWRSPRVHSGAPTDGGLSSASGRTGCRGGAAPGRHQLRRGEDAAARQTGEPASAARSDILPLPARRQGRRDESARLSRAHRQRGLHADDRGSFGMTTSHEPGSPTIVAPQVLLGNHLKALKLPTFAREYEKVAMESAQDRADYPRYLLRLCELERIDRERRNVERRIRLARFSQIKSLDTFDFAAQPSLNKPLVLELARCEWIEKRQNCIALGPSGTGKTHVALSLGLAACQKGYSVAFTSAAALVHELMEARDERRLRALQKHLNTVKLLIVEELGYAPFTAIGSELLFEVFSQRYERGATLVTSNLPFDEWTSVFGSERLTGALLDRLTHHVHILEMNGDSYRLATAKKTQRRSGNE
jgi:DNA replication protein DnaC